MSTEIKTKESTIDENLGDFMSKSGVSMTNFEDDQLSVLFENNNKDETFGDNSESSDFDIEKELFGDIKEAESVLNESNGVPSSIEPDSKLETVSDDKLGSDGTVAKLDEAGVRALLSRMDRVLEDINTDLDEIKNTDLEQSAVSSELIILKEKLSDEELNYIRKIFPELRPLINEGDIEIIDNIQLKLNLLKKGKGLKEKLRILINNKEITQAEGKEFFAALKRKDNFVEEAKKKNISPKIANSIFRVSKSFLNELEAANLESENGLDFDKKREDEIVEDVFVNENLNDKYAYIKNSLLDECDIYRNLSEDIRNQGEKTRILNAIKTFEDNINKNFGGTIEIDEYVVDRLAGYSLDLKNSIDKALLVLPEKESFAAGEEQKDVSPAEESAELKESLSKEMQRIIDCRRIASEIKNPEIQKEIFNILREFESEMKLEISKSIPNTDKIVLISKIAEKYYVKYDHIIKRYDSNPADDKKASDISKELEGEEEKLGKRREVHGKIVDKFESLGVDISALKDVEGFDRLSGAKQFLVFKNYQSVIWDKIHIESKTQADREWNKNTFFGKVGRLGLSVITLGTARTYREKMKQKEVTNSLIHGEALGYENRKAILESLVEVAKETPEVTLDSGDNIHIEYVEKSKFRSNPYASEIIDEFNQAASEYASLPYSWFDDTNPFDEESEKEVSYSSKLLGKKKGFISGKERAMLSESRDNYNYAKEEYLKLYLEEFGDSPEVRREALRELNSLDEKIRMNQMFNSDPRAEDLLQNIDETSVFNQALSDYVSKKGQFMAYGSLTRIAASLAISGIATPVALAVFAGVSYARGKREVRDMLKMKRESGILNDAALREEVVYNVDLEKSLADLKKSRSIAQSSGNNAELYHLNVRIGEVEEKIKTGHKIERKTRRISEFRDAKFFSDRIDSLVEKYDLLNNTKGQESEAKIIERKIAQTSTLMRELLNNNLLSFGNMSGDDSKSKDAKQLLNKLSFIQALSKADTIVSVDDESMKKKIAEIVKIRRDSINNVDNDRSLNHIKQSVKNSIIFGGVGYGLTHLVAEFFGGGTSGLEHSDYLYEVKKGESFNDLLNHNIKALGRLDTNARNNAISNFTNHLSGEQLKEIGISNPHNILPGQKINIDKLKEIFDQTRVNGRTVIENAEYVSKGRASGGLSMKDMMRLKDESQNSDYSPSQDDISPADHTNNINPEKPLITHEDIRRDIADKNFETPEEAKYEINGVTKPRPAIDSDLNINHFENIGDIEEKWFDLSIQDRLAATETIIPEYIKKMLGENIETFNSYSKSMPASSLLINNASFSHAKIDMLKELKEALFQRQITPEKGFEYNDGMSLYDYVNLSFRAKIISEGPISVK